MLFDDIMLSDITNEDCIIKLHLFKIQLLDELKSNEWFISEEDKSWLSILRFSSHSFKLDHIVENDIDDEDNDDTREDWDDFININRRFCKQENRRSELSVEYENNLISNEIHERFFYRID